MKSKIKLSWRKNPSVTREGKYFYRAEHGEIEVVVLNSWTTGKWNVELGRRGWQQNTKFLGDYDTPAKARAAAQKLFNEANDGFDSGMQHNATDPLCIDNLRKIQTGMKRDDAPLIQAYWLGYRTALEVRKLI